MIDTLAKWLSRLLLVWIVGDVLVFGPLSRIAQRLQAVWRG